MQDTAISLVSWVPTLDFIRRPRPEGSDGWGNPMPRVRCKPPRESDKLVPKSSKAQPDRDHKHHRR